MKMKHVLIGLLTCSSMLIATTKNQDNATDLLRWKGFNLGINSGVLINQTKGNVNPDGDLGESPGRSDAWHYDNLGFTAGGQLGYKYQISHFVIGAETDFNYSYLDGTRHDNRTVPTDPGGSDLEEKVIHHLDWFGTVRPIIGVGFNTIFFYATGGFAYGRIRSYTEIIYRADPYIGYDKDTKIGWSIGGGLEYGFCNKWSLKLEYLFIDLDNIGYRSFDTTGAQPTYYFYTKFKDEISAIRLALNWMF
jgi:outer membrane immunogenic protein